jgi:hypothetical protein
MKNCNRESEFGFFLAMFLFHVIQHQYEFAKKIAAKKLNILIIWGDDIGKFNVSACNHGIHFRREPVTAT